MRANATKNVVNKLIASCGEADFVGDAVGEVEVSAAAVPEESEV